MKRFNEKKQDYPKDWDFEEMLDEYGFEYLGDYDSDLQPMDMEMIDDLGLKPLEAIQKAFFGIKFGFTHGTLNEGFDPNDEWFAFNGHANFVSISDRDLNDYLEQNIEESHFFDWCVDQGLGR